MLERGVFSEEGFPEGVLGFDELNVVEPVVGEFVFLVDENQVGVLDVVGGFGEGGRDGEDKQGTEKQRNKPFH